MKPSYPSLEKHTEKNKKLADPSIVLALSRMIVLRIASGRENKKSVVRTNLTYLQLKPGSESIEFGNRKTISFWPKKRKRANFVRGFVREKEKERPEGKARRG